MKEPDVDDARAARGAALAFWAALRAGDDLEFMRVTTNRIHEQAGTQAGMTERFREQVSLSPEFVKGAAVLSTALVRHNRAGRPFLFFYCRDFRASGGYDESQIFLAFEAGSWKVDGSYLGGHPDEDVRLIDIPDPIDVPDAPHPRRPT